MILIKSFDNANEYLDLDTKERYLRSDNPKFQGWFKSMKGVVTVLFVNEGDLFFQFDHKTIKITESINVELNEIDEKISMFKIIVSKGVKYELPYEVDKELFGIEPFDYIEEEEFDWGLFLANIINDKKRKELIISSLR